MPSKPKTALRRRSGAARQTADQSQVSATRTGHRSAVSVVFIPFVALALFFWFCYRSLFSFPVWFDETIGKALFFGLPVWLYVLITGTGKITDTLSADRFKRGLWLGISIGGIFGFVAAILAAWRHSGHLQTAWLFSSDEFWGQFGLALLTACWETLFFFSFIQTVIQERFKAWSWLQQAMVVAAIFLVFHLPNIILRFSGAAIMPQVFLLAAFGLGQALLFTRERNAFALILSHAIWGMVLLVHF